MQRKALRIINKAKYNAHSEPLFKVAGILKLTDLFVVEMAKMMHDYFQNMLPCAISKLFIPTTAVHDHNTRQITGFHYRSTRTQLASNSIMHKGPQIWANIPTALQNIQNKTKFAKKVKATILNKYDQM